MEDVFGVVGLVLAEKYEISSLVAQGGFGLVYKARHVNLKKAVAIKVLLVPDDLNESARGDFVRQFLREAETIAAMDHPAIVRVLDSGVNPMPLRGDAPWIALDWIDGENLHEHLEARRGHGGRTPAEALELLRPAFEALAYAHETGIAHRDVKPGNLMLPRLTAPRAARGGAGLRLLDFGIAKLMEPEEVPGSGNTRTRSRYSSFSPDYAAAEQLSSLRTGPWTDVHALSLILCEVLTDTAAYDTSDPNELYLRVLSPTRPSPRTRGVDVGAWEAILVHALSIPPQERFGSAGEFLAALEAALPYATHERMPESVDAMEAATTLRKSAAPPATEASATVASATKGTTLNPAVIKTAPPTTASNAPTAVAMAVVAVAGLLAFAGYAYLGRDHHAVRPTTSVPMALPSVPPSHPSPSDPSAGSVMGTTTSQSALSVATVAPTPQPQAETPVAPMLVPVRAIPAPRPVRVGATPSARGVSAAPTRRPATPPVTTPANDSPPPARHRVVLSPDEL